MNKLIALVLGAALPAIAPVQAADLYAWRSHAAPLDFRFGNEIDTHQQTYRGRNGNLWGFLYVANTGVVTSDGYPVATHVDCDATPDCVVGWAIQGQPMNATFLYHPMNDHPIFQASRADIPQPGSYAHFHWLGQAMPQENQSVAGYALQLTALARFCFIHHNAGGATPAESCRKNGGVPVRPGTDIATHLNILPGTPPM